ncbi:phosphoesterase [Methanoplanus sp. FWC-SCC4]|uniref:Phosphoesterase n=1 Tax=Methanochimaera problematica TaxID=2609417 RepID=A0AA97FCG5_9EURY|nr:metallophosphoesterase [Methanoplanus sp. FWC-SCC4]WOF16332.1 phosphoesterase [Methanoplanus sp. FWC-SCC4]
MIPEFLPNGPAILVEDEQRILVVADTHFGAETGLARHGLHIKSNSKERLLRLLNCIDDSDPDLLLLLGDVKHSIPVTTKQEFFEMPNIFRDIRRKVPFKVIPGNHDIGIEKFLKPDEILSKEGVLINNTGYMHGHTYPSKNLLGHLILAGHHHPVAYLYDEVGCSLKAQPAYVLSEISVENTRYDSEVPKETTRVLFVPAFFELAGGMDVRELSKSRLSPLSRSIIEETAEVFLSDGTYINNLKMMHDDKCDRSS